MHCGSSTLRLTVATIYSREALRQFRDQRAAAGQRQLSLLEQVPPDAPSDDAPLTVWNGDRFVTWQKWLATAPITVEPSVEPSLPVDADCVTAICGGTKVWLVREGDRWLMYAGARRAAGKRRDFASPSQEHAIRTAEQWYGAASGN